MTLTMTSFNKHTPNKDFRNTMRTTSSNTYSFDFKKFLASFTAWRLYLNKHLRQRVRILSNYEVDLKQNFNDHKDPRMTFHVSLKQGKNFPGIHSDNKSGFSRRKIRLHSAKTRSPLRSECISKKEDRSMLCKHRYFTKYSNNYTEILTTLYENKEITKERSFNKSKYYQVKTNETETKA
jgi:hypothetical protein